jgi:hypothetical protein
LAAIIENGVRNKWILPLDSGHTRIALGRPRSVPLQNGSNLRPSSGNERRFKGAGQTTRGAIKKLNPEDIRTVIRLSGIDQREVG